MNKIKLMLVDDQSLIREGLEMMLSLYDDLEIVGQATNGNEAIELLVGLDVDVILMDIKMPKMNGVEGTKIIKEKYPEVKILILTTFNEEQYIFEGLKFGADGYMLKDTKSDEIVNGIRTVYNGNVLLQPEVATKVVNVLKNNKSQEFNSNTILLKGEYEELTLRERDIALLVAKGKNNKEISKELFITEGTVKNHLTRILGKLGLENRTQLALYVNDQN